MIRRITGILMVVCIVVLLGWDIFAVAQEGDGSGNTISEIIRDFSHFEFFPFVAGVLIGHWFWNGKAFIPSPLRYYILGAIGLAVVIFSVLWSCNPMIPLVLGVPLGRIFWPQERRDANHPSK
jgi:hypothetical protein